MTSSEGATMTVSELISSVNGAADSNVQLNEDERLGLLAACAKLHSKLESPFEASIRIMFAVGNPHLDFCYKLIWLTGLASSINSAQVGSRHETI